MWPVVHDLSVSGLQADALFASTLQRCDEPGACQVRQAAVRAIREFGYSGCAVRVAQNLAIIPRWQRSACAGPAP